MRTSIRQTGISLIELIMFIVILGVGIAGFVAVFTTTTVHSSDPLPTKQAIAIAESLLTEIEQQPFTYCDPQDGNVLGATSNTTCAVAGNDQDNGGGALTAVPAGEQRGSAANPFDNVADYNGYSAASADITGNSTVAGYTSTVTITRAGGAGAFAGLPAAAALKISVHVQGPSGADVTLTGYRVRYAPNSPG